MPRTIAVMALFAFAAQGVLAPLASSADISRAEYVEQSEPICKANTVANTSILKGVQEDVRDGKLKVLGAKFSRAARALHHTIQRLEQIPRPSADESRLVRWFTHLNGEVKLLERVAGELRKERHASLGKYFVELRHNENVTNNIVLTFGFEYCLLQTARYI
jgi:hypothetical protein